MQAKLQALVTIRNSAKSWRRNLQGYSWHTEEEMDKILKWSEFLGKPFSAAQRSKVETSRCNPILHQAQDDKDRTHVSSFAFVSFQDL